MFSIADRTFKKCFVGCLVFTLFGCDRPFEYAGVRLDVKRVQYPNGLSVVLVENHTSPVISYQTWFDVGSADEHIGITGMSHLFEHLFFKGTPRFEGRQFFELLEAKGIDINAYTTRDYTVFYETFSKELLNQIVTMESDRLAHFVPTDDLIKNEKMILFEEKRLKYEHAPEVRMEEALWQMAYHQNSYQWPIMGYGFDVDRIELSQAQEHFQNFFQPSNATLIVVGDFITSEAEKTIRSAYQSIPSRRVIRSESIEEFPQTEERRLTLRGEIETEKFLLGYHICAGGNPDSFSLDVLSNILFEGVHSRVYRSLVLEKKWVLEVSGTAFTPKRPGLFLVSGTMKAGKRSLLAEVEIQRMIRKIQDEGVTLDEIQIAQKQLEVAWADHVRSPFDLGQWLGTSLTLFKNVKHLETDLNAYQKVTAKTIQDVANRYLIPNNRSVVNLVPNEKKQIKKEESKKKVRTGKKMQIEGESDQ